MSLNPTMVTTSENALYLFLTVFGLVRLPHSAFPLSLYECIVFFTIMLAVMRSIVQLFPNNRQLHHFFLYFCPCLLIHIG